MKLIYNNNKVKKECCDEKFACKTHGKNVADKILSSVQYLENADELLDIKNFIPFHFELLYKDDKIKKRTYSIRLGAKTGYRLLLCVLDANKEVIYNDSNNSLYSKAVYIEVIKITNHYQ